MNVIGGLVSLLLLFGVFVCIIGNHSFIGACKNEYASVTHYMADSVAVYVNGDHIDSYLAEKSGKNTNVQTGCLTPAAIR